LNIYASVILDFKKRLEVFTNKGKSHEQNESAHETIQNEQSDERKAIYHDDEDDDIQRKGKDLIAKIFEIEPNMDLFDSKFPNNLEKTGKEEEIYSMSINSVIDELKDALSTKKKSYNMQTFKRDKSGAFTLKTETSEELNEKITEINKSEQENTRTKNFDQYSIPEFSHPSDFRLNLMNELRNRQTQVRKKEAFCLEE